MSEDSPFDSAPRVLWAHTSPLLADPEWIAGFLWMIERLLSAARKMKRHENMPSYRDALLVREWHPFLEGLSLHVMKAVDAGRNGPALAAYALDARVDEAFQLTCAMLDDMLVRKAANKNKDPIPLTNLEAINELLEAMHVPDASQQGTLMSSYSRVVADLSNFLDAYHDASPFLEGSLCPEGFGPACCVVDELATLARSVRLVWVEGSQHPGGAGTALQCVDRIARSLAKQWETGRTIRLDQADKERLGKALEWLKAADSPDAPQASVSDPGEGTVNLSRPSRESTPETAVIDYQALADEPRKRKRPTRKGKPPRPTTLAELAATIRAKSPRGRNVASFLEIVDLSTQTTFPAVIHFDDIREKCHGGGNVNDDTVERTLIRARREIASARLQYRINKSGMTAVVQRIPPQTSPET